MTETLFAREIVDGGPATLPAVDSCVTVTPVAWGFSEVSGPVEALTRIEDVRLEVRGRRPAPAELVISQPAFAGDLYGDASASRYLVRWTTERGMHEVPARFHGRERLGPLLVGWRLQVAGPVCRIQRRAHARVAITVPVEMVILDEAGPHGPPTVGLLPGVTVNLSEGGMLAALPPGAPAVGSPLTARFAVADEAFAPAGRVVRHQPTPGRGSGWLSVAVAFDTPDAHGDRLRPLLFAHQLRARRAGVH